jgi:hypothetical protein
MEIQPLGPLPKRSFSTVTRPSDPDQIILRLAPVEH